MQKFQQFTKSAVIVSAFFYIFSLFSRYINFIKIPYQTSWVFWAMICSFAGWFISSLILLRQRLLARYEAVNLIQVTSILAVSIVKKLQFYGYSSTEQTDLFFQNKFVKYGLMPLILLITSIGLFMSIIFKMSDEPLPVLSINHNATAIFSQPPAGLQEPGDKAVGEFIAKENGLGIVGIKFDTGGKPIDGQIEFRIKGKGQEEWYYTSFYNTEQFQNNEYFYFDFPKIYDSKNYTYTYEVSVQNLASPLQVSRNKPLSTKYFLSSLELKNDPRVLIKYAFNKIISTPTDPSFLFIIPIILLPLILYLAIYTKLSYGYVFIFYLTLLVISEYSKYFLIPLGIQKNLNQLYTQIVVFLGLISIYLNRGKIRALTKNLNHQSLSQKNNFSYKHFLILAIIIAVYTFIKLPYLGLSFTGSHAMKYSSYVESALHMIETNNPFHYQQLYRAANPLTNPEGIIPSFGHLPLMEWGLAAFIKFIPFNSLEIAARTFTHTIGVLTLIAAFFFLRKVFTTSIVLTFLTLLSVNTIFNFSTYVTVNDSLLMLFFFCTLYFLKSYYETKRPYQLLISGLMLAVGISVKFSLLPFIGPISLILIYAWSKNPNKFLVDYSLFAYSFLIPKIIFGKTVYQLPNRGMEIVAPLILGFILYILIFFYLARYTHKITNFLSNLRKTQLVFILLVLILLFWGIFASGINISGYSNFITDSRLIFNYDLYSTIVTKLRNYSDTRIFSLFILSALATIIVPPFSKKKPNHIFLALVIGAITYLLIASKVIYFHNYYLALFMITITTGGAIFLYLYSQLFDGFKKYLVLSLLVLFFLPQNIYGSVDYINRSEPGIETLAEFLKKDLGQNNFVIDETGLFTLPIYTGTPILLGSNFLNNPTVSADIQNLGFKETMDKYHIKYVITYGKEPNYSAYAPALLGQVNLNSKCDRSDLILTNFGEEIDCSPGDGTVLSIEEEESIKSHFKLEKIVGSYHVYLFQQAFDKLEINETRMEE